MIGRLHSLLTAETSEFNLPHALQDGRLVLFVLRIQEWNVCAVSANLMKKVPEKEFVRKYSSNTQLMFLLDHTRRRF